MPAAAVVPHGRQAEDLDSGILPFGLFHCRDELTLSSFEDQDGSLAPSIPVEEIPVFRVEDPFDHRPGHLRKSRYEMMISQGKAGDAIHRVGNDARAFRKLAHHQALWSGVAAESTADF